MGRLPVAVPVFRASAHHQILKMNESRAGETPDSQTLKRQTVGLAALRGIVQEVVWKSVAGSRGWLLIDASLGVER